MIFLPRLYTNEAELTVTYHTIANSSFWGRKTLTATRSRGLRKLKVSYLYDYDEFGTAEIDNNLSDTFIVPLYHMKVEADWSTPNKFPSHICNLLREGDYLYTPENITTEPQWEIVTQTQPTLLFTDNAGQAQYYYPCLTCKIEAGTRTVRRIATTGHIVEEITFIEKY